MTPSCLTRRQVEARRLKGDQLLKEDRLSQAEIARHPKYLGRLLKRLGWQFRRPSLGDDAPAEARVRQR